MKAKLIGILGWYGVLAILGAYGLVSFEIISAKGYTYQILNLTGAVSIAVETISKKDKQPAVLNIAWAIIALLAIIHLLSR